MGRKLEGNGIDWTRQMMGAYLELIGVEGQIDAEALPIEDGFEAARREAARQLGLQSPEKLDIPECRLEWSAGMVEGSVSGGEHVSVFKPDEPAWTAPEPGTEVRIRIPGGSCRALVLQKANGHLLLARAPNRVERREHPRVPAGGYALVKVGGEDHEVPILDISEGGVGLSNTFLIETGSRVDLLLRLGSSEIAYETSGLVVNCRKAGDADSGAVGVSFTRVPGALRREIRRIAREEPTV